MENQAPATAQSTLPRLPESWIEKLFKIFTVRYGNTFIDQWRNLPADEVKQAWAEELAGLNGNEIAAGLERAKAKYPSWPPKPLEFLQLCRPSTDPKAAWEEAREQMRIRLQGAGEDRWSSPKVYWAAVKIGQYDLQTVAWEQISTRWEAALAGAKDDEIPPYRAALPVHATTTREEAVKRLHEIAGQTGVSTTPSTPGIAWAIRLAEREAGGESLSPIQTCMWREALGVTMHTSAKDALAVVEKAA